MEIGGFEIENPAGTLIIYLFIIFLLWGIQSKGEERRWKKVK